MVDEAAPAQIEQLARRRARARADRDFTLADDVRAQITALGWVVRDTAEGYLLAPRPPYDVLPSVRELPDRSALPAQERASVAVLVEGWPDDVRACLAALLAHTPAAVSVLGLDLGNVDGAGDALHDIALHDIALHEIAQGAPERVREWHVEAPAGWAAARTALLRADTAAVQVWLDPSTVLTGDAVSPVLAALADPGVVAAGWRGVNVEPDWRSFSPGRPGEVDALNGYLLAVRRSAALAVGGPHPKARYYRNADLEFCFALRAAGLGRVVMTEELPVVQGRHHGYHDTPEDVRNRESKRNYDRFLTRFRGRDELRTTR